METFDKIAIVLLSIILAMISSIITYDIATRNVREQAVMKGYAQWKVNDRGTEVTFEWKK